MSVQTFNPTDLSQNTANWAVAQRIVGSFAPHAQVSPDLTIALDPGYLLNGTTLTEVKAQVVGPFAPPASGFRIDRVVVDRSTGIASVVVGTANSLTPPAIPLGKLPVARVMLQATTDVVTNTTIVDERVLFDQTQPTASQVICRASLNGVNQTGVAAHPTVVKVMLSNASIDVGNSFDAANNSFKPKIPGHYRIYAQIAMNMTNDTWLGVVLKLNGSSTGFAYSGITCAGGDRVHSTVEDIVYLNGTTDYVDMCGVQNVSSSGTFIGASTQTYFLAQKIG
ncbi:hypothetical protein [Azospirillum argentinense]|uniref:C1q domain-containing protein n=1 Tax=Azospirillum argentinense TaxID=2970906 RepID=A0A5B0L3N1_9PROT|nr:hypothetical protein [Azospirillum argentinense]KAA1058616.1 hypothetical protein FH063_000816 [Azospirillum argentinense]